MDKNIVLIGMSGAGKTSVGRALSYRLKMAFLDMDDFIEKKLAGKQPDQKELKKVSDALARRGYNWSDISAALRRYGAECDE